MGKVCRRRGVSALLLALAALWPGAVLCCEVGQTYLLFLKRTKGAYFQSSNGPFGIYRVK